MIVSGPAFLLRKQAGSGESLPFAEAYSSVCAELTSLADGNEVFAAHLEIAEDPMIEAAVEESLQCGMSEKEAVEAAREQICRMFEDIEDEYLRARVEDVRDIFRRIMRKMEGADDKVPEIPDGSILVAEELFPSDTGKIDFGKLKGIICQCGSSTSHVCIIAHAKGLPVSIGRSIDGIQDGDVVQIDDPLVGSHIASKVRVAGRKVYANAGSVAEIRKAISDGADGIGLFRTEFLFLGRDSMPSEEEQYEVYREAIAACGGKTLTIRTLDVGGDKQLPWCPCSKEENPFLGLRGIRFSFSRKDIFNVQMRAISRAITDTGATEVRVMLPMVSRIEEIREAKKHSSVPSLGIMVETPAAVLCAREFAAECDFFSIGTNDLTQYIMAADRGNASVAYLYDAMNPAVQKALAMTVDAARDAGIPVGICGELASDPRATDTLLALGFDSLSLNHIK